MTRKDLLDCLKNFTEEAVKDVIMPTKMQKGDTEEKFRIADVYEMRLPDSTSYQKWAPYIIHQLMTGNDSQERGNQVEAQAVIRTIFCVYHKDEQEGSLLLLELMERFRIALLMNVIIGSQYELDLQTGLESLVYPDDTAPFFAGEMVSTWKLPPITREVREWLL